MNSKAIRKQLLAAVAMVLVAAVALGSSTYAWFVQAGKVTATGMQVNVESTGGLVIAYKGKNDVWGTTATAGMTTVAKLKPVSTSDFTDWATATAKSAANYAFNKETIENVTTTVIKDGAIPDSNGYVIMKEFLIRAANANTVCKGLKVDSVDVKQKNSPATDTAQNLSCALRVGIEYSYGTGEAKQTGKFIMAPVDKGSASPSMSYKYYANKDVTDTNAVSVSVTPLDSARIMEATKPVPTTDGDAVSVKIYIWYEGQDNQLFTDNVHADEDLLISVHFTADEGISS